MKRLLTIVVVLASLGWSAAWAQGEKSAETPPGKDGRQFTVECHLVVVSQKLALALIPELSDDAKIAAAWPRVLALIDKGEATLSGLLTVQGLVGEKVVAESVREMRYATEYDPPVLPDAPEGHLYSIEALKNWPAVGITPVAFETRNLGPTLELSCTATTDSAVLLLTGDVRHTRFERFVKIDCGRLANGECLSLEQPYFTCMRNSLQVRLRSGERRLVGVHKLPGDDEGKYELFFLCARFAAAARP